jgi:hypothetical protein
VDTITQGARPLAVEWLVTPNVSFLAAQTNRSETYTPHQTNQAYSPPGPRYLVAMTVSTGGFIASRKTQRPPITQRLPARNTIAERAGSQQKGFFQLGYFW